MSLIQALPPGPLDIVGDIHGEFEALEQLLAHLGYGPLGEHAQGRTLVFVGDFCDRGPDSPAVLARIAQLVKAGRAVAVLGNHEINLLRGDAKDGAGWYFDARIASDTPKYAPFARPSAAERAAIIEFLAPLPVALERQDLRIVHAAWRGGTATTTPFRWCLATTGVAPLCPSRTPPHAKKPACLATPRRLRGTASTTTCFASITASAPAGARAKRATRSTPTTNWPPCAGQNAL